MMNNDMNANVIAARTALTPIVWGTTYAVTTTWLPAGHPVTAGLLRALPAGLILILITRTLPTGSWWWRSAVLGILNIGLFFTLLFMAAQQLPGGVAAILTSTSPLVAMAISPFLLGIKPTRGHIVAAILALLGVSAITLTPGARLTVVGVIAGLGSAISMGFGMVLAKRWGQPADRNPLDTTAWQLIAGGAVLIPFAIAEGPLTDVDLPAAFASRRRDSHRPHSPTALRNHCGTGCHCDCSEKPDAGFCGCFMMGSTFTHRPAQTLIASGTQALVTSCPTTPIFN